MTSQIATRRRLRPGAFLTGSLIALVSLTGLAATPARAQEVAPGAGPGFLPVVGTWIRGGVDSVAWVDLDTWYLVTSTEGGNPFADPQPQAWRPVAGDWDGDGVDTLSTFQHVESTPVPAPVWVSVAGDWDGDGIDSMAGLHMPTGHLALADEESLFGRSASAAAGPDVLFAPNGGSCTTKEKNVTYTQGKKYFSFGGWIPWCKKSWEEWTCCLVSLKPFKYSCSVVNKSKTYDTTCPPPDFWP